MIQTAVNVRDLGLSELSSAGAIVGRAVSENPVLQKVFAAAHSRQAAALGEIYGTVLRQLQGKGVILGAEVDGTIVGVAALVQPGRSQLSTFEKLALARVIQSCASMEMALGYQRWQAAWALREPKDPHWRLGPVAVEPGFRRHGVGTALLKAICARIDRFPAIAVAATDDRNTLHFYGRAGFREVSEAAVMGLANWFLLRARQR
jgi:GNAT superfamily N-acetyltransferase